MHRPDVELQASEICRLFSVSKTTLFRWENEDWMPPVSRNASGARRYRSNHVNAIARFHIGRLRGLIEHASQGENLEALEQLFAELSYHKFLAGDIMGLREMILRDAMDEDAVRDCLLWISRIWPFDGVTFVEALELLARAASSLGCGVGGDE